MLGLTPNPKVLKNPILTTIEITFCKTEDPEVPLRYNLRKIEAGPTVQFSLLTYNLKFVGSKHNNLMLIN